MKRKKNCPRRLPEDKQPVSPAPCTPGPEPWPGPPEDLRRPGPGGSVRTSLLSCSHWRRMKLHLAPPCAEHYSLHLETKPNGQLEPFSPMPTIELLNFHYLI